MIEVGVITLEEATDMHCNMKSYYKNRPERYAPACFAYIKSFSTNQ